MTDPPVIDDYFIDVWDWFNDLNLQRQEGNSIAWLDIKSYFELQSLKPDSFELDMIQKLDRQYLEIMTNDTEY